MKLAMTYSESYVVALALDDAIKAQEQAETTFRTSTEYSEEMRERMARSAKDRAQVLRQVRERIDA